MIRRRLSTMLAAVGVGIGVGIAVAAIEIAIGSPVLPWPSEAGRVEIVDLRTPTGPDQAPARANPPAAGD